MTLLFALFGHFDSLREIVLDLIRELDYEETIEIYECHWQIELLFKKRVKKIGASADWLPSSGKHSCTTSKIKNKNPPTPDNQVIGDWKRGPTWA